MGVVHGTAALPEVSSHHPHDDLATLDRAIADLVAAKAGWAEKSPLELAQLIDRILVDFEPVVQEWIEKSLKAKRIEPGSARESEEWLGGPFIFFRALRFTRQTLVQIHKKGRPELKGVRRENEQQESVRAMPHELFDLFFFPGIEARTWLEPGQSVSSHQVAGAAFREQVEGRVCLVLGAGNVSSIAPLDVLYKMFVEKQVVVLKMNPVNDYLGPIFAKGFKQLIDMGALRLVYGGVAEGQHLCYHPDIHEIHVTGSNHTHDAIVYGVGEEGATRKLERRPRLEKKITSELGNVSPLVIVPGPWSEADIDYQAHKIVSMLANNAGFNCNATRVIVNQSSWPLRRKLLDRVRSIFAKLPTRHAYYPGAEDRYRRFVTDHPEATQLGSADEGALPWTFIEGVDSGATEDIVFKAEAFCSVLAETTIEASDTAEYLNKATDFLNQHVWGSLNACMIIHPKTARNPAVKEALDHAIQSLRYGTISINLWPALGYALGSTPWGAFPGHESHDVQSGQGVVHNALMLDRPQKTVIRGPFKIWPLAPWFVNHPNPLPLARSLTYFQLRPKWWGIPKVLASALFARWL
ncbi:MAG: aldehyde dehydrogenase family protein [Acidobacteria bacterium]|nr:aldehyde dehydrogenase family protein [Acidobacteriota bacterium]